MESRRYLSFKKIALASLALGIAVGCFFVLTALSFDPDGEFHDIHMNLQVGRLVLIFLYITAIFGFAILILGLAIRCAIDLWKRLTKP